jgi:hypothetical protein
MGASTIPFRVSWTVPVPEPSGNGQCSFLKFNAEDVLSSVFLFTFMGSRVKYQADATILGLFRASISTAILGVRAGLKKNIN